MLGKDFANQECALARALEVVGERWTLLIVRDAFYGVRRFRDFAAHLDVPRAILADRLRGLVEAGVLERRADAAAGGRDVYELTPAGRELWPALYALMRWGTRFQPTDRNRRFLHATCEEPLGDRGACPRCGVTPAPEEVVTAGAGRQPARSDRVSGALHAPRRLLEPLALAG
jgi:DNA-binding HxlR family transcriptional regulator